MKKDRIDYLPEVNFEKSHGGQKSYLREEEYDRDLKAEELVEEIALVPQTHPYEKENIFRFRGFCRYLMTIPPK